MCKNADVIISMARLSSYEVLFISMCLQISLKSDPAMTRVTKPASIDLYKSPKIA